MSPTSLANVAVMIILPPIMTGLINRVKSLWAGRKGPPLLQPAYDVLRLLRKSRVYSATTTPVFRVAPYVYLATALGTAAVTPLTGSSPLVKFPFDFVWLAYMWALGRVAIMLAALDTGSSFEGMGVAREATFSTLVEPALFLVVGALCLLSGNSTLSGALTGSMSVGVGSIARACGVVAFLVVLQVEAARMPVDDPSTHLELTMVHEVMVLDHGGPELAAIQTASALKLFVGSSIVATLLNPLAGNGTSTSLALNVLLCGVVAMAIGTIESLIARLRLRSVPQYLMLAIAAGAIALLASMGRTSGTP